MDNPRTSNASRVAAGPPHGHGGAEAPQRAVELVPYVAARGVLRPQFSDAGPAHAPAAGPDRWTWGWTSKAALTSDLALTATFNPDFGQVEADQLILNLTTFETFFPEKRPFFTQGLELFQPVGTSQGRCRRRSSTRGASAWTRPSSARRS